MTTTSVPISRGVVDMVSARRQGASLRPFYVADVRGEKEQRWAVPLQRSSLQCRKGKVRGICMIFTYLGHTRQAQAIVYAVLVPLRIDIHAQRYTS